MFEIVHVFVHDGVYCVRSGAGTANHRFLISLVRLGYGPRLLISPVWTPEWNSDYDEQWHSECRDLLKTAGARLLPIDNGSGGADRYGDVENWRVSSRRAFELVRALVQRDKRTLVISFDSPFLDLIPLLRDFRNLTHVHVPRGTALLQAPDHQERLNYEMEAFRSAISNNTFIGGISAHMENHLSVAYGVLKQKLIPMRCGVLLDEHEHFMQDEINAAIEKVGVTKGKRFLLSFGRAEQYKGFHILLEALALTRKPPQLVLISALVDPRHSYVRHLQSIAQANSLPVRFLTSFDFRLPRVLQQAKALLAVVVPSLVEPFGLIVAEVLMNPYCRAPVICSRVGGMAEQVIDGETGFTFRVGDVADLADKIRAVRSLPDEERRRMKEGALARQNHFDMLQNVRIFLEGVTKRV